MKTETVILLVLLLVVICIFVVYVLLHKKDNQTKALHDKVDKQQNEINNLSNKNQEKVVVEQDPVYVPVIYGGYGWGNGRNWTHGPYWRGGRRWRR